MKLLDSAKLEQSSIVANSLMNRERGCTGGNSYAKELGFNPLDFLSGRLANNAGASWLDLCCGTGRALIEAAQHFRAQGANVEITGMDLVPAFAAYDKRLSDLQLSEASLSVWDTAQRFDLITCVHGLHYLGDKLGLLARAAAWLKADGVFAGHLDLNNLRAADGQPWGRVAARELRRAGFAYDTRRRLVRRIGAAAVSWPWRYLGADDQAGPNYTGQPAINSYYE